MINILIEGLECSIGPYKYPCIHTCNIIIQKKRYQLNDFILESNTIPKVLKKKGFFSENLSIEKKILAEYNIDYDFFIIDLFEFELINFDLEKGFMALNKLFYNKFELEDVLHS